MPDTPYIHGGSRLHCKFCGNVMFITEDIAVNINKYSCMDSIIAGK